ncbi:tetratricopeptide repeat protein [Luteimonas sp. e5]
MGLFIAAAAVLAVLTLGLVLRPLRGDRATVLGLAVVLLSGSALLYWTLGTPDALNPDNLRPPETPAEARALLEKRLAEVPDDAEAWRVLGHMHLAEDQVEDAARALARAAELQPDNPDVLVEAAEVRARAREDRHFDATSVAWLEQALRLQPQHARARLYLGVSQRQAGRPADAAATWEPLLAGASGNAATALREQINDARREAGLPPLAEESASDQAGLPIEVRLAPALAARSDLGPDSVVFVSVREAGGAPMPVAARRLRLSELPASITLGDGDSPMPTRTLSQVREVEVSARLSASGSVERGEGDIESAPVRITLPASTPVRLELGAD